MGDLGEHRVFTPDRGQVARELLSRKGPRGPLERGRVWSRDKEQAREEAEAEADFLCGKGSLIVLITKVKGPHERHVSNAGTRAAPRGEAAAPFGVSILTSRLVTQNK